MIDITTLFLVVAAFFGAMYFYAYMEAKRYEKKKNMKH